MQFQFDVAPNKPTPPSPVPADTVPDLLRQILEVQRSQLEQMLEVQREQLQHLRAAHSEQQTRWKNLVARWQKDFPGFLDHCQQSYPVLEKAYMHLLVTMVEELSSQGDEALDTEFAVQDFIDRYGMRIGQMGHLVSVVAPFAEAANQAEAK